MNRGLVATGLTLVRAATSAGTRPTFDPISCDESGRRAPDVTPLAYALPQPRPDSHASIARIDAIPVSLVESDLVN